MTEFEYTFMTYTVTIEPGLGDATGEELSQAFAVRLSQPAEMLTKGLRSPELSGNEVVSHSVTRIDRHLLITFLLRQPKQSKD